MLRRFVMLTLTLPVLISSLMYALVDGIAAEKKCVADIRGAITDVQASSSKQGNVLGFIRVEGKVEKDTVFDKASVRITSETVIERKNKDKRMAQSFNDLKKGQQVEASFTGPVAESYPVQARAKSILILKD